MISYACYAIWYGYACQPATTGECTFPYACYAIGYGYACQASAIVECGSIYCCYRVSNVFICYLCGNNYFFAKRNYLPYHCSSAVIESISYSIICYIIDISFVIRFIIIAIPYHRAIAIIPTIAPTAWFTRQFTIYGQSIATSEYAIPYTRYAIGYCYACQAAAIVECVISYARYAIGYVYVC